ncbi:MAG: glycoside hydrolase family 2 TIM barrel-domain containing protein [Oscillospiraceae bacterium]
MNTRIPLNDAWQFVAAYNKELKEDNCTLQAEQVRLPHTVQQLPVCYANESDYQMECGYRRVVHLPQSCSQSRILLHFGAVAHSCKVYFNGQAVATHACGYTAFTADVTRWARFGQDNILALRVNSKESQNIPPFGGAIDYLTYGGIYREVELQIKPQVYIRDVFAAATQKDGVPQLCCKVFLSGDTHADLKATLWQGEMLVKEFAAFSAKEEKAEFFATIPEAKLWTQENPQMYRLRIELAVGKEAQDIYEVNTGFRSCEFKADGFYLNDVKTKLVGLNRHQSWPHIGYAAPGRMQRLDADILKNELGVNAVRTSHYPQSQHFVNRCDELGLLVFTEIPGWQHIGNDEWKKQAVQNTADMVKQYRNHPSVIIWGTRINESPDDDELYTATNAQAHSLDTTRQTGGVRNFNKSHLLEDVYTYNDFIHNGKNTGAQPKRAVTPDMKKGYVVTEYNGHMFPTKSYDDEAHRQAHALRHATVLQAVTRQADIAGSFGWCMFDYQTHRQFGAGDGICHHGVLDMYRNPKYAAAAYRVAQNKTPVLQVCSSMDIGDYPGGWAGDVYVFTNADTLRISRGGQVVAEYPLGAEPNALLRGPLCVRDLIGDMIEKQEGFAPAKANRVKKALRAVMKYGEHGMPLNELAGIGWLMVSTGLRRADFVKLVEKYATTWGGGIVSYTFEALRDGEVVASCVKEPVEKVFLTAEADTLLLKEDDTYDMATVRICAQDQNKNNLPYYTRPVRLHVKGPLQIVGPDVISLAGGMGGAYLRTTGESGTAVLTMQAEGIEETEMHFTVE